MRHNKSSRRFARKSRPARAMFANMTSDLMTHGRIQTTVQKAKELRKYAEKMITLGKAGDVSSRRRAMAYMGSKSAVTRLFDEIAPIYKERNGGYTRILKIGVRPGDAATMAIIELVEEELPTPRPKKKAKKTAKVASKAKAKEEVSAEAPEADSKESETEEKVEATPKAEEKVAKEEVKAEAVPAEAKDEKKEAAPADVAHVEEKAEPSSDKESEDKDK